MIVHTKTRRRRGRLTLTAAVTAAMLLAVATGCGRGSEPAADGSWQPSKPVTIVAHGGPGTGGDTLVRLVAEVVQSEDIIPQRITVENRTGGGSAVAQNYMGARTDDPYTIGLYSDTWLSTDITDPSLKKSIKDMTPVIQLAEEPLVMAVPVDSPYDTLNDFIEAAKANPHGLKQAGGSLTSVDNLMRELLQRETGSQWDFIPFEGGGERIAALLSGRADLYVGSVGEVAEQVRGGKVKAITTLYPERLDAFPGVPTLQDQGFTTEPLSQSRGLLLGPDAPQEAVDYYVDKFRQLAKNQKYIDYLNSQSNNGVQLWGDELREKIDSDYARMEEVLKSSGIAG